MSCASEKIKYLFPLAFIGGDCAQQLLPACVGVDAHIDPAIETGFTEISGEFVLPLGRCGHPTYANLGEFQKFRMV